MTEAHTTGSDRVRYMAIVLVGPRLIVPFNFGLELLQLLKDMADI